MHHWNWTPPIALSAQSPIAQTILSFADAKPLRFGPIDSGVNRLLPRGLLQASRLVDPANRLSFGRHKSHICHGCVIVERKEGINHWQTVFPREIEVALEPQGDRVVVTVADTGEGIPAARREGLFQRPQRPMSGGTVTSGGLGLLIVHRMLALNGSGIRLVDRAGRGAVFEFALAVASLPAGDTR